jgi:predicted enzyme related to lactoylglutathione lyase
MKGRCQDYEQHSQPPYSPPMLCDTQAGTPIPASDIKRARTFYEEVLGFTPTDENPDNGEATYRCAGGTWFFVHPSEHAGTNRATSLAFMVADIESEMAELRDRGVTFEEYDLGDFKTVDGISVQPDGTKMAWFNDTEGNLLGIGQPPNA